MGIGPFPCFLPAPALRASTICEVFALLPTDEPFGMCFRRPNRAGLLVVDQTTAVHSRFWSGGELASHAMPSHQMDFVRARAHRSDDRREVDMMRAEPESSCRDSSVGG